MRWCKRERVLRDMNSEGIKKNFRERNIGLRGEEREQDSVRERERVLRDKNWGDKNES